MSQRAAVGVGLEFPLIPTLGPSGMYLLVSPRGEEESGCIMVNRCVLSHLSRVQLCDPVDCSPPGSSVHGILQARILEGVAIPSCRGSSPPRDGTHVSCVSCTGKWVLYHECHLGSPEKYYLPIKRNEVVINATKWMNLENSMLIDKGQAQKAIYCMITFI